MAYCENCNAGIEWHKTLAGKNAPIDPLPRPDGDYYFDNALLLVRVVPGSTDKVQADRVKRGRLFKIHFDTCTNRRPPPVFHCDHLGCELKTRHLHCRRCGDTDHLVAQCESEL